MGVPINLSTLCASTAQGVSMSNERLTLWQIILLMSYAVGMSGGQVLFKLAAIRYGLAGGTAPERILGLLQNLYLLSALVLYAGLAVLWVWILSFTPLSRAYPFFALALALTLLLSALLFGETMSMRHILGVVLILSGLFLVMD
jgi:drug/metabolite transporter (DMT)-like permease